MHTPAEYQRMYGEYCNKIYRYFRRRVASKWDAEDLTATVFLKVYAKQAQYDGRYPFRAWIYRIAHNTLVDFLRKRREQPVDIECLERTETDVAVLPEQQLLRKESRSQLWEQVGRLTAEQAALLTLKYQAGLPTEEIAALLGKSTNAIKASHHRALKQLHRRLVLRKSRKGWES